MGGESENTQMTYFEKHVPDMMGGRVGISYTRSNKIN